MILNASLFIPNWQIHHELNLLAASWIHLSSIFSVIHFNLDYSITLPALRKSVSNSRKILAIHLRTFCSFLILSYFFVFISMPSPLPPKGNSQLRPINSIFLRIHNFLLNSEKCGLYKRFKLLLCDVKVIKRPRFISPLKNVKWTYSAVPLKSAIFVRSFVLSLARLGSRLEEPWVIPVTERVTLRGRSGPGRIERKGDGARKGSERGEGREGARRRKEKELRLGVSHGNPLMNILKGPPSRPSHTRTRTYSRIVEDL